jgi:hypothetical protein
VRADSAQTAIAADRLSGTARPVAREYSVVTTAGGKPSTIPPCWIAGIWKIRPALKATPETGKKAK